MYNYCVVYITAMLVLDYGGGASNGPSSVVIPTLEVLQCCSAAEASVGEEASRRMGGREK